MKRLLPVFMLFCLMPGLAWAHLVSTGFGSYYDGMVHMLQTPADILLVVTLGLLSGQAGRETARPLLLLLPAYWLLAGMAGMQSGGSADSPMLTTLSFGLVAMLVLLDRRPPHAVLLALACLLAAFHGYLNGAALTMAGMDGLAIWGAATLVFLLATLLPALVISLHAEWMRIGVRVAGSWIAAVSLLMLGWIWHMSGM
ncbi:HupE/UreJ family protein [bacterium]|nr:HupE/UreJ family protein [bacterium]